MFFVRRKLGFYEVLVQWPPQLLYKCVSTYVRTSSAYLWITYTSSQYGSFGSLMKTFLSVFFSFGKIILFSPHQCEIIDIYIKAPERLNFLYDQI